MAELLRELRRQTNGAVVGDMHSRGIDYPLSYGVSAADVKALAARYAPDHAFARLLASQQVRELRMAAYYIADPALVCPTEACWAESITTAELAEHAAMLIGQSPCAEDFVVQWLTTERPLLQYAALLSGAKALAAGPSGWDTPRLVALIKPLVGGAVPGRGIEAFVARLWQKLPAARGALGELTAHIRARDPDLWARLEWQLSD